MLNQNGRSLVDLIVGMTVGAILITGAFQLHTNFIKSNKAVKNEAVLQEHLARANQILEKDIRMAGYNLVGNGLFIDQAVTDNHVVYFLRNEESYRTTVAVNVSSGSQKVFVAIAAGAQNDMWACFSDEGYFSYHKIVHVGINTSGNDTLTFDPPLTEDWEVGDRVDLATGYRYSLESSGNVVSLVRRIHNDHYTISDNIDALNVIAKDASGSVLNSNFEDARSVSIQLTSQIKDVNSNMKSVVNTVEAAIRNPS